MALFRFLQSLGEITRQEAESLRARAKSEELHPIEALTGRIEPERIAELMTAQLGLPLVDLSSVSIQPEVVKLVPKELAVRSDAVPIRLQRGRMLVAFANPLDAHLIKTIEFSTRVKVDAVVASLTQIRDAIRHNYFFNEELRSMLEKALPGDGVEVVAQPIESDAQDLLAEGVEKAAVIRLVELLLVDGLRLGASDIHIEPAADAVSVRYRINGVLESGVTVPKSLQTQVVARIKVMAQLDITERRRPQDGAIRVSHQNRQVDVRVSVLPTPIGEKVVLRLLDPESKGHSIESLGLSPDGLAALRREGRRPEGMILISGPTGSGKSTTAHAILTDIADARLNIVTIENPVEHRIKGITQVEVNEKQGVTFAGTLRSILRQDPDVIFVGEIRDAETAKIALQASQTGHLVISTVHTIDATASITRLLDLELDPLLVANSLRLVVAQRLVRVVCPSCRAAPRPPSEVEANRLDRHGRVQSVVSAVGCKRCRETGYTTRCGVYEVLPVSPSLRAMIERHEPETSLRSLARAEGVRSMPEEALRAVEEGITTPDEVLRVIPPEERSTSEAAPAAVTAAAPGTAAPAVSAAPETFRVLIVDDDAELLMITRGWLEAATENLKVVAAESGEAALAALQEGGAHIAILDIGMPGPSGLELCARLRANPTWAQLPVLMLTGRGDTGAKVEAFRAGADDYIVKPAVPEELFARIDRALSRAYGVGPRRRVRPAKSEPVRAPESPAPPPEPETGALGEVLDHGTRQPERITGSASDAWKRFIGQSIA